MEELKPNSLEKIDEAFTRHQLISIRKINGEILEPGYIVIRYGDVAFRVQPKHLNFDSQFVRLSEIEDIYVEG
jgi:hypothetical protein